MAFKRSSVRSRSAPPYLSRGQIYLPFYVYVLKSEATMKPYVGHTSKINTRLKEHNSGKSKSTKSGIPWKLVYCREFETRSEAMKCERYYKTVGGRIELKDKGVI